MVIGAAKILINTLLQYPFVTLWLYIPRSLGLNMIVPHKLLIDSRLSEFSFSVSNKTAPKVKKMPRFAPGQVKINLHNPSHDVAAKVDKIPGTTKTATIIADGGGSLINFINPNQEKAGSPIHIAHPPTNN